MGVHVANESVEEHNASLDGRSSASCHEDRDLDTIEQTTPSIYVWLVAIAAAIG